MRIVRQCNTKAHNNRVEQVSVVPSHRLINRLPDVKRRVPNCSTFLQRAQSITDLIWNVSNQDVSNTGGRQHRCSGTPTDGLGLWIKCVSECVCVCVCLSKCRFFNFPPKKTSVFLSRTESMTKMMWVEIYHFQMNYSETTRFCSLHSGRVVDI